jgi:hypothetical protein
MAGVYGDQLAYFPELMIDYTIFSMAPKTGAGYGARRLFREVEGYLSRKSGGQESVVTDLRTENQKAVFYCEEKMPAANIIQGLFVEDDGELYQFIMDNGFVREGGFVRHGLQLVTGNTDRQTPHRNVNLGLGEYK